MTFWPGPLDPGRPPGLAQCSEGVCEAWPSTHLGFWATLGLPLAALSVGRACSRGDHPGTGKLAGCGLWSPCPEEEAADSGGPGQGVRARARLCTPVLGRGDRELAPVPPSACLSVPRPFPEGTHGKPVWEQVGLGCLTSDKQEEGSFPWPPEWRGRGAEPAQDPWASPQAPHLAALPGLAEGGRRGKSNCFLTGRLPSLGQASAVRLLSGG